MATMRSAAIVLSVWLVAGCDPQPPDAKPALVPADATAVEPLHASHAAAALLDRYLASALQRVQSPACLQQDQHDWQARTDARCAGDAACLASARGERAAQLEGLVPGALLDAATPLPAAPGGRLLAVAGGQGDPQQVEPLPLEQVTLEGRPREAEGGFLLAGDDFDAEAYETFESLLGDEAGLRAHFGEGPILLKGVSGALPAQVLDVGDLAAVESVLAQGGRLRVRGWASPEHDGVPTIDGTGCVFIHGHDASTPVPAH